MPLQHRGFVALPAHAGPAASTTPRSTSRRADLRRPHRERRGRRDRHRRARVRRSIDGPARRWPARSSTTRRTSSSPRTGARTRSASVRARWLRRGRQGRRGHAPERARVRSAARRGCSSRTSAIPPCPARAPCRSSTSARGSAMADVPVAGRTRWTVYDPVADAFHVNIMDPPQIVVVDAGDPVGIRRVVPIAHAGPHGLDIDVARRRLFCACDAGVLLEVDADSGSRARRRRRSPVSPTSCSSTPGLGRLYVAIGDAGRRSRSSTRPRCAATKRCRRKPARIPWRSMRRGAPSVRSCP